MMKTEMLRKIENKEIVVGVVGLGYVGLPLAVEKAKAYVALGIQHGLAVGHGHGPIHHFVDLYRKAGWEEGK